MNKNMKYLIRSILILLFSIQTYAADVYDAKTGILTIGTVSVGDVLYSNVKVTVGNILSVGVVEIDDSYELSLLRYMHLMFGNDGIINFDNLTKYMDLNKKECQEIQDFFINYPGIFPDYQFYYSDAGIIIRKKWFEIISLFNFDFTIKNQIKLLEKIFPKLITNSNNLVDILEDIYSQLNFNWDSFYIKCDEIQEKFDNNINIILNQKIFINNILIFIWSITTIKDKITNNCIYSNSEFRYL